MMVNGQLYREAVAVAAIKAPAPAAEGPEGKRKPGKTSCTHSGKHASSECYATVEDVLESSTGKSKKSGPSAAGAGALMAAAATASR